MKLGRRILLTVSVLVFCVGCDQATKYAAQIHLSDHHGLSFFGDTFRLQLAHNHGAFLGLGDVLPEAWRFAVFALGVALMLLMLLGYILFARSLVFRELFALSLLLAGGAGNLIDRVMFGYVVDFMNIGIGPLRTGIFNIADIAVSVGAVILVLNSFKPEIPSG